MGLYVIICTLLCFIGLLYGHAYGGEYGKFIVFVLALIVSIPITLFINFILSKLFSFSDLLYGKRKPRWTLREQLAQAMVMTRHHRTTRQYDQAIRMVNGILSEDPEFPDALLLKAQILWEGFENSFSAKQYLRKAMRLTSAEDTINEQAFSLYKELMEIEKNR